MNILPIVITGPPTTGLASVLVPIDNRLRLDGACTRLLLQVDHHFDHFSQLRTHLAVQVLLPWSSDPTLPFPNQDSLHPCLSPSRPPCRPPLPGGRHLPPPPPAHPPLRRVLLGAACPCPRVLASVILPLHLSHLTLAGGPPPLSRPCMSSGDINCFADKDTILTFQVHSLLPPLLLTLSLGNLLSSIACLAFMLLLSCSTHNLTFRQWRDDRKGLTTGQDCRTPMLPRSLL